MFEIYTKLIEVYAKHGLLFAIGLSILIFFAWYIYTHFKNTKREIKIDKTSKNGKASIRKAANQQFAEKQLSETYAPIITAIKRFLKAKSVNSKKNILNEIGSILDNNKCCDYDLVFAYDELMDLENKLSKLKIDKNRICKYTESMTGKLFAYKIKKTMGAKMAYFFKYKKDPYEFESFYLFINIAYCYSNNAKQKLHPHPQKKIIKKIFVSIIVLIFSFALGFRYGILGFLPTVNHSTVLSFCDTIIFTGITILAIGAISSISFLFLVVADYKTANNFDNLSKRNLQEQNSNILGQIEKSRRKE